MVINVEYNQLDPLLRGSGHPDGDVNDESGFSPYPGNINQVNKCLVLSVQMENFGDVRWTLIPGDFTRVKRLLCGYI